MVLALRSGLSAARNGIRRLFALLNHRAEIALVIHAARTMSPVLSKVATSFEADAGWIKSNDRRCMARNLSRWNLIGCSAKNYMVDRIDAHVFALIWKDWKS
jgi:hypothetical protein